MGSRLCLPSGALLQALAGSTVWLPEGLLCFVESAPVSQGQDRLGLEVDTAGHWEGSRNSVARRKT